MALVEKWINVVDPVLNPVAPHVIARHYLVADGRVKGKTPRLVLAIHGGHGHAEKMATEHLTPKPGYVIAYPSGSNKLLRVRVDGENLSWNTYSPYESGQGWAGESGVNDELFLTSLVSKLCSEYAITKTFGVGVSRGGMMARSLQPSLSRSCPATAYTYQISTSMETRIIWLVGTNHPRVSLGLSLSRGLRGGKTAVRATNCT
jgi:hypothetical protein